MNVIVNTDRGSFRLCKDYKTYSTYWCCVEGTWDGALRGSNPNVIAPISLSPRLQKLALAQGYTLDDLAAPKRPKKYQAVGTRKPRTPKTPGQIRIKVKLAPPTIKS